MFIYEYGSLSEKQVQARALDEDGNVPPLVVAIAQVDGCVESVLRLDAKGKNEKHQLTAIDHLTAAKNALLKVLDRE